MELVTHNTLHFTQQRGVVWAAMGDVGSYTYWWPWLRTFDAAALTAGDVWQCTVRPPLPYTVSFAIAFTRVVDGRVVEASVSGDIVGVAELTLTDAADGCEVVVRSDLQPNSGFLKVLARTIPAVVRYGHDWILATGAKQFAERALITSGVPDTTT